MKFTRKIKFSQHFVDNSLNQMRARLPTKFIAFSFILELVFVCCAETRDHCTDIDLTMDSVAANPNDIQQFPITVIEFATKSFISQSKSDMRVLLKRQGGDFYD